MAGTTTIIDITTESLRSKGFEITKPTPHQIFIKREDSTMPLVTDFDRRKFDGTIKRVVKKLEDEGVDKSIILEIQSTIAINYDKLINGVSTSSAEETAAQGGKNPQLLGMAPKAIKADCSIEEWRARMQIKYNNLRIITEQNIPGLWLPLEFAISIKCVLNIDNITLPFIGIILGPPSSLKSVAADMLKGARDTFYTDNFSPKAFVSHNSNMSEEELQQQDLLPKIKNRMFLVSELAPLFTTKDDELAHVIGIIMRIADGNGYWSDSGARGHRGYDGPLMFTWLGAAVDIPYKVHKMLSALGPKLHFLRIPMTAEDEDELLQSLQQDDFRDRVRTVKVALFDYLECLESCPNMKISPDSGIPKVHWNTKNPTEEQAQRYLIYLGELLAYLRGTVTTWETEGTQGLDYAYASRSVERVKRGITQLYNLARGHALSQGRDYITIYDDLPLIVKVALSGAASIERVKVLDMMLNNNDGSQKYSAREVADAIGTSIKTAKRTMAEFKALGLVDLEELGNEGEPYIQMLLKDDFRWFFEPEFKELKGDYKPGDFKDHLVKKKEACRNNSDKGTIKDYTVGGRKTSPTHT